MLSIISLVVQLLMKRGLKQALLGRVLTSVVAVACLRAQSGVGPQVTSHIFGLRKALDDTEGTPDKADEFLSSEEGCQWVLEQVDRTVQAFGGSNFGRGASKL